MRGLFNYIFLIVLLISCKKEENGVCLKPVGKETTISRTITNVHHLNTSDRFEIIYHQDSLFKIDLIGGENVLPGVVTEIKGDTLYLRNGNACDWFRNYKHKIYVHIHLPQLRGVYYSGSGTFKTQTMINMPVFSVETWDSGGDIFLTINADTLRVANHAGTADFYLNGIVGTFYSYVGGNGFIHAQTLNATDAFVNNSGTGEIKVKASGYLEIQVFYTGNVLYYSHPATLDIREYDSGRAIRMY